MKNVLAILLAFLAFGTLSAREKDDFHGIFNHFGVYVSAGTEGIGTGVASPVTKYLEASIGLSSMPGFKISGDADVRDITNGGINIPISQVNIEGKMARTACDFKISCYPFGDRNALFVATGFSFGGNKIIRIKGYSDDIKNVIAAHPQLRGKIIAEIDKYNIKFSDQGEIAGYAKVNSCRPYIGLGYGRLVPRHRVGFRFEMGCQFQGKIRVCQAGSVVDTSDLNEADDDLSKFIDKFSVYPVIKFTLTGRIL